MTEMLPTHTDQTLLTELGHRVARVRVEAGMTQARLAFEAGISTSTVTRLEAGHSVQLTGFIRILRVLGLVDQLDRLIPEPQPGPLAQLERAGRIRQRAPRKKPADTAGPWTWGDQ